MGFEIHLYSQVKYMMRLYTSAMHPHLPCKILEKIAVLYQSKPPLTTKSNKKTKPKEIM